MIYNYEVIDNGEVINTIVADEDFAQRYSQDTGYTVRQLDEVILLNSPSEEEELRIFTDWQRIEWIEGAMEASGCKPDSEVSNEQL